MKVSLVVALAAAAIVTSVSAMTAFAGDKPKPKPTVTFAKSWEAALAEAKLLNVPIVVHNHGFYCGPCWGMHQSVLQNADYIKFAEKSTVEVIAESRLDEGWTKKEERAATYTKTENGKKVEYMVEWPNLTYDEMIELDKSPAGHFNDTGFVPFTCLVDPYTEKEITRIKANAAGAIIEAVKDASKSLVKEHGAGIARATLRQVSDAEGESADCVASGEFGKAIAALDKVSKGLKDAPQMLTERLDKARADVIAKAEAALDAATEKKDLSALVSKLKGTGLEQKAADKLKDLSASAGG